MLKLEVAFRSLARVAVNRDASFKEYLRFEGEHLLGILPVNIDQVIRDGRI